MEPKKDQNNIIIIDSIIKNKFEFLTENYTFGGMKTIDSKLLKYWISWEFNGVNRDLSIDYFPFDEKGNYKHSISFSVDKHPHGRTDFLGLGGYLMKHLNIKYEEFKVDYYEGNTFEEKAEKLLSRMASLLQEHAMGIINGTDWEDGLYPEWD